MPIKKIVQHWIKSNHRNTEFTDHLFQHGDRIFVPLMKSECTQVHPHPKVLYHLHNKGYTIHDYAKGMALDQHRREVRIGKILSNADPETLKAFSNDQARNNARNPDMVMCITRDAHDVATISTNRGWNSCLNMIGGSCAHKVEHQVISGAHAAYLVKSTDTELKNPMARISLNPHHSIDQSHTILSPERITYGTGCNDFKHSVNMWCETTFDYKHALYKKDDHVYNDDKSTYVVSKKPEHEYLLLIGHKFHKGLLASSTNNTSHLQYLSKDFSRWVRGHVAARYVKHINDDLQHDADAHVRRVVALTGEIEHLDNLLLDPHPMVRAAVASSGHKHHLDVLIMDADSQVRCAAAMHGSEDHLNILMKDQNPSVRKHVALYGNAQQVEELAEDPNPMVRTFALKRQQFATAPQPEPTTWTCVPYEDND